jgi:hypothetical protein
VPDMPDGLRLPPDPFAGGAVPPDMTAIHDFYLAMKAAGFEPWEALVFIAQLVIGMRPGENDGKT